MVPAGTTSPVFASIQRQMFQKAFVVLAPFVGCFALLLVATTAILEPAASVSLFADELVSAGWPFLVPRGGGEPEEVRTASESKEKEQGAARMTDKVCA